MKVNISFEGSTQDLIRKHEQLSLSHFSEVVTASFPLISNYSALISHLSVAVVSALSARRLA